MQVIYHCTVRTLAGVVVESTRSEYGGEVMDWVIYVLKFWRSFNCLHFYLIEWLNLTIRPQVNALSHLVIVLKWMFCLTRRQGHSNTTGFGKKQDVIRITWRASNNVEGWSCNGIELPHFPYNIVLVCVRALVSSCTCFFPLQAHVWWKKEEKRKTRRKKNYMHNKK